MNRDELLTILADDFHDWTDGDDPVKSYEVTDAYEKQGITVTFEDDTVFWTFPCKIATGVVRLEIACDN